MISCRKYYGNQCINNNITVCQEICDWTWLFYYLQGKKIEKPKILKNPPKIFKSKPKAAKAEPAEVEGEAGPSSDGLESVPLEDAEEPGPSAEEGEKAQV